MPGRSTHMLIARSMSAGLCDAFSILALRMITSRELKAVYMSVTRMPVTLSAMSISSVSASLSLLR